MSKRFRRLSHSLYECKYHVVFCPKYRYRVLVDEVGKYTAQQIQILCQQKEGVEVLELDVRAAHVHLVLWIQPKYTVSNLMGYLKGKLAIRLFQIGRQYWARHLGARGYCVSTVGIDETQVRIYMRWQEVRERHIEAQQGRLFD